MFEIGDNAQAKKERTRWGKGRDGPTNEKEGRTTSHFAAAVFCALQPKVWASQPCAEAMKKVCFAETRPNPRWPLLWEPPK